MFKKSIKDSFKTICILTANWFIVLFILTVNYPIPFVPNMAQYMQHALIKINSFIAVNILSISTPFSTFLVSDSLLLYIHVGFLLVISILLSCCILNLKFIKEKRHSIYKILIKISTYYLALQLLNYGFAKIFKTQFYLPEPNTLFTTVGQTPKDLLYWSTMGVSRGYNLFLGFAECLAALMLLFKRTHLIGSLIAFGILINILAINLSYDISVKLFTCFLLFCSFILLCHYKNYLQVLFLGEAKQDFTKNNIPIFSKPISIIIGIYFIFCTTYHFIKTNNFNDDAFARPALHGAYETYYFSLNNDPQIPVLNNTSIWRRIFFHRQGYFIAQYMNDGMQDYNLTTDTAQHFLKIQNTLDSSVSFFNYALIGDTVLHLKGKLTEDSVELKAKKIDLNNLPALQKEFNFIAD